jgi:hypothetical protein
MLFGLLAAFAAGEDRDVSIARLLEECWSVTPQARQAADAQLQGLLRSSPLDMTAIQAGWLVLMQQRRFDEAQKLIDQHLKHAPDDLGLPGGHVDRRASFRAPRIPAAGR